MNLYIFPALPSKNHGYGIAVASDYEKVNPQNEDIVIWYTSKEDSSYSRILLRPGKKDFSRAIKVLQNKVNCEVTKSDLNKFNIDKSMVDNIFCGDVIFYRALREMFPQKKIIVRFHNCFARIKDRIRLIDESVNLKFKIQARAFYQVEKEIFHDVNTHKIFISNEDRDYYTSNFGIESDSEVWKFEPNLKKAEDNRSNNHKNKLIHFGGLQSHKIDGLNWFINEVFQPLRKKHSDLEFHLWGKGSEILNNPTNGIYGHGFFDGDGLPHTEDGLYVNPDLIGGGIKIKLLSYFEQGASFISTPFGYEGYSKELVDNKFYYVIEKAKWFNFLDEYFSAQ